MKKCDGVNLVPSIGSRQEPTKLFNSFMATISSGKTQVLEARRCFGLQDKSFDEPKVDSISDPSFTEVLCY